MKIDEDYEGREQALVKHSLLKGYLEVVLSIIGVSKHATPPNSPRSYHAAILKPHADRALYHLVYSNYERETTLVFYPHGNLALCRNPVEQEFKLQGNGLALLNSILAEWRTERVVPLFVCEGTLQQKIASIQNSYYLSTIYREVMASPQNTLTVLGWGLGEQDLHLLQRLGRAGIRSVAVSVFQNNQTYCNNTFQIIQQHLGPVQIDFFDSGSPGCWIDAAPRPIPHFGAGGPLTP